MIRARIYTRLKKFDEALTDLNQVLRATPDHVAALNATGNNLRK